MMAEGYDDCEGDIVARIREIVGGNVPIGIELDPHCHLTEKMVSSADAIVILKEYPHIDWEDRGRELYAICSALSEGRIKPVSAVFDCRMVGFYPTTVPPMSQFVQLLKEAERLPGILSVSLAHGFPWGDQSEGGTRLLVIANGDRALAMTTAQELGWRLYAIRNELLPKMPKIDEALALAGQLSGRIVLADTADNAGGGAPGDTTHLLRAMLAAEIGPSAFGTIYDPASVRACAESGVGARIWLRLGGKLGMMSGDPLDVEIEVKALASSHYQSGFGLRSPLGTSAWVRIGRVDVVLASLRSQVYGGDAFTGLGINLDDKRIIAIKSSEHFRAEFGRIADHVISVATPGALAMDFASIPYRKRRDLNYHPRVADPLGTAGLTLLPCNYRYV
jgi:microcystin degradation protein MlrC